MKTIDKTLEYHELLMVKNSLDTYKVVLPQGYSFEFWKQASDLDSWIDIHISSGEFTSKQRARQYFYEFYGKFLDELDKRCFFIVYDNTKIATATISPSNEYGYNCVIDWLAISKDHQGKHLAKPLVNKCLEVAKSLGYSNILLHTQTHTYKACKVYLDLGFEPFRVKGDNKGWQILNTLIDHPKLSEFDKLDNADMYDQLIINIVNTLDTLHKDYVYEVWYKNNANDVYVNENGKFYRYKFYDNGNTLKLN